MSICGRGEIILRLKEQPAYGEIQLHIALPFAGHDAEWDELSQSRMAFLIRDSIETVIVGNASQPAATNYRRRNEYMADHADCVLAVYDNDRAVRGGTGMTVNYARRKKRPCVFIHPDTAKITMEGF